MKGFRRGLIVGLAAILLTAGFVGCSLFKRNPYHVELAKNVYVLTDKEKGELREQFNNQTSDKILFTSPTNIPVGAKVVSSPVEGLAPKGIAPEEVTRVSPDGRTLYVQRTSLEKMIKSADIKDLDITPPSGYITIKTPEGISTRKYTHGSLDISYGFNNVVLYKDKNGNPLIFNGLFEFISKLTLGAKIREFKVDELSLKNNSSLFVSLGIKAPKPLEVNTSYEVDLISPPYFVDVGGIPIDMQTVIRTIWKFNGKFSGNKSYDNLEGRIDQISYSENGWSKKSNLFEGSPNTVNQKQAIKIDKGNVSVEIDAGFRVYDTLGAYLGATEGLSFYPENSQQETPWKVFWDSSGAIGLDAGWLSGLIKPYKKELFKKSQLIAQGPTNGQPLAQATTKKVQPQVQTPARTVQQQRNSNNQQTPMAEPRELKYYFFQGNELYGLEKSKTTLGDVMQDPNLASTEVSLPFIMGPGQLNAIKRQWENARTPFQVPYNLIRKMGVSFYKFNDPNSFSNFDITQLVMGFDSPSQEKQFYDAFGNTLTARQYDLLIETGNIGSFVESDPSGSDAKTFFNSVINWAKRIGGKFYRFNTNQKKWVNYQNPKDAFPSYVRGQ